MGKPYGIKLRCYRCYWECLEKQLGNLGNLMGTWWEHNGNKEQTKKYLLLPLKEEIGPSLVYSEPSHWLHETFISKIVCHHFWHGLMGKVQFVVHSITTIDWFVKELCWTPHPFHKCKIIKLLSKGSGIWFWVRLVVWLAFWHSTTMAFKA